MSNFFESEDLWDGLELPIICGTGEKGVGKTLFGLNIDPYNPETGKSKFGGRTLVFDFEGSSRPHKRLIAPGCYFNMTKELVRKFGPDFTPFQLYEFFMETVQQETKDGGVSVLMIDPVSELEAGLIQWVERNPTACGYTANQFKKSKALFMGAVKAHQKKLFDSLSNLVGCVYIVAHMRNEFSGGTPTGRREAKGKETNFELASLYLKFERDVIKKGPKKGSQPERPSATVLKTRLNHVRFNDETGLNDIVPILPPRLPVATPETIRQYIAKPADFNKLTDEELVQLQTLSEDERLMLKARMAEDERMAAEAKLSTTIESKSVRQQKQYTAPQGADDHNASLQQKAKAQVDKEPTKQQMSEIKGYAKWFQENGVEDGRKFVEQIANENDCFPSNYAKANTLLDLLIDEKLKVQDKQSKQMKADLDASVETIEYADESSVKSLYRLCKEQGIERVFEQFMGNRKLTPANTPADLLDQMNSVMSVMPDFIKLAKKVNWPLADVISSTGGKHPFECDEDWLSIQIENMRDALESHQGSEIKAYEPVPF